MRISFGGRHLINSQESLEVLLDEILPRTIEASMIDEGYGAYHRIRVNLPAEESSIEFAQVLNQAGPDLRNSGIDLSYMVGRGPGTSFKDLLLAREGDVTALYGAEDMDIRQIQPEVALMAEKMLNEDTVLGSGCRPRVMLNPIPEADVMRQLHEVYYVLAAGNGVGVQYSKPENPHNLDLSEGSSVFVGTEQHDGFGDLTTGLALFNHRSTKAQDLSNYFSHISTVVESEMFTTEYALFMHNGVKNTLRSYASYIDNKFYGNEDQPSETDRIAAMKKTDDSIKFYNGELMKIPDVAKKLEKVVGDPQTKTRILQRTGSWDGFTQVAVPHLVDRVDRVMREIL